VKCGTYGGNAVSCAAALAVLDEKIIENVSKISFVIANRNSIHEYSINFIKEQKDFQKYEVISKYYY
jgi:4-aminobutyrate aminotransferase-like enzyme